MLLDSNTIGWWDGTLYLISWWYLYADDADLCCRGSRLSGWLVKSWGSAGTRTAPPASLRCASRRRCRSSPSRRTSRCRGRTDGRTDTIRKRKGVFHGEGTTLEDGRLHFGQYCCIRHRRLPVVEPPDPWPSLPRLARQTSNNTPPAPPLSPSSFLLPDLTWLTTEPGSLDFLHPGTHQDNTS